MFCHTYDRFSIDYSRYEKENNRNYNAPIHCHNTSELILILEGMTVSICDGKTTRVTAPALIHYPPGSIHEQINTAGDSYARFCFSFDPSYIIGVDAPIPHGFFAFELSKTETERLYGPIMLLFRHFGDSRTSPAAAQIAELSLIVSDDISDNSREKLQTIRLSHLLSLFLFELEPIAAVRSETPGIPKRLSHIRDLCSFVSENLTDKLTIDSLADRFFVSRTKLTTDFRRVMNMSFTEYLILLRISSAKSLLIHSPEPVSVIADKCGFCSSSHMINSFRKLCGCTPAYYRERYINENCKKALDDNDIMGHDEK